jgi:hypothetical protein
MKKKALITGALPRPFTGPWVELDPRISWYFEGIKDGVKVELKSGSARAVINEWVGQEERISVIAVESNDA